MIYKSYTIRFVLHRRTDTPRQHLQMRVTPRGGKPVSFATGKALTAAEWDANIGMAKGRTPEAAEANTLINKWSRVVEDLFSHYDSLQIVPTAEQLRKDFARATNEDELIETYTPQPTSQITLIAAYTQFIVSGQESGEWSNGTVYIMSVFRRLLSQFKPDVPINMVDDAFMEAFHKWLVNERNQQGVSVAGNLQKMRWFLKWARKKGIYDGDSDRSYRPKVKGANEKTRSVVFLTLDELRIFEKYEFAERHYQLAKDVFLFCCNTGLRHSDILKLRRADIHGDSITFTTQKTNSTLTVPLNDKAKAILDKYAKCHSNRRQKTLGVVDPAIPTPDQKTVNKHLHDMMKMVGIDAPTHHIYFLGNTRHDEVVPKYELITTHTARHTFIVTAIGLGIPIPVIMGWTGHSNYNAMLPYISVANDTSTNAMQKFNTI